MKRILFASILGGLVVLPFGLMTPMESRLFAGAQNESGEQHQVRIGNFSFGPQTLSVPVGASVTWVNDDDIPHNVRSAEGDALRSDVLDTDEKFSHKFDRVGTYPYYCSIHPKMTGKVIVR